MQCSSSSCSSGCGGHVVACPCPEGGNPEIDSLEKVVTCFWQNHQGLAAERDYYEGLESFASALDEAALALGDENLGYDRPDRISAVVLSDVREKLSQAENALATCTDFDALHQAIEQVVGPLAGMTPALVYLTALRIGLQAGLHPTQIYLEAGARAGCESFVKLNANQLLLSRDQLPRIFQHPELTTEDVQSCLAICKHQLRWLSVD